VLNIPEELKLIYRNDRIPIVPQLALKELSLYFPDLDLTIATDRIVDDSFELQENLCSSDDLTIGACEGAGLRITVANLIQDLSGYEFIVTQTVNGTYTMPLGTYRVDSCKKQNDLWFREIVAYDSMIKTNIDVSPWYNALTWPQTVKSMRESLLTYLGIAYEEQTITNDTVTIPKTLNPASLLGRDVLRRLCEINAGFGHITRENKFKVIQLSGLGLYPSEELYPAEDLFPSESGEYLTAGYETADYEEYIVEPITSITIREDDDDFGTTAGTTGNPYIITGNFLLYGKTGTEVQPIVDEMLLQVKNKFYRPHNTVMMGLPYLEVGDSVTLITTNDAIESFVFRRTLKGIQALKDNISATGNKVRRQTVGVNTQIQQLNSKTYKLKQGVDGLEVELADTAEGLEAMISFTAEGLQTQITDNKEDAESQFIQQADQIALRVTKGTVSSEISLESGQVTISGNRLVVNSTNFQLDGSGNATFSGNVTSANMTGGTINGSEFVQSNGIFGRTEIKDGMVTALQIMLRPVAAGGGSFAGDSAGYLLISSATMGFYNGSTMTFSVTRGGSISCTSLDINGVAPSLSGHTHSSLYNGTNQVFLGSGGGFASQNGGDLGSPTFRWGTVYAQTGTINTSDRKLKNSIEDLPEIYEQLILRCRPVRFKYNDGTSDRYHTGFISQEVEELMIELGIDSKDFGGFVKAPIYEIVNEDGEFDTSSPIIGYIYMLRYEEFISPAFQVIKKQQDQLKSQEERMNAIEERIKALEEGVKNG
jgi:archaellum component FlaC